MRNLVISDDALQFSSLQCGRVSLDAESRVRDRIASVLSWLQCGRVSLDAESPPHRTRRGCACRLQCGRVSLDAESDRSRTADGWMLSDASSERWPCNSIGRGQAD